MNRNILHSLDCSPSGPSDQARAKLKPLASCKSPTWQQGPPSAVKEMKQQILKPVPMQDAAIAVGSLTLYATTPAQELSSIAVFPCWGRS